MPDPMGDKFPKVPTPPGSPASYMPGSMGPFECDRCEYFQAGNCRRPETVAELGGPKGGQVVVDAKGCCNFFEPDDGDNDKLGDDALTKKVLADFGATPSGDYTHGTGA